ncbi:hypothetical protein Tco_0690759 [Tanacetum coccineum]
MAFCSCGRQAVIKTSWSDGHPGRRFYGCIKQGPCCRWIGWVDPPMCPRSIQIIPGLLRARNRHEASIQELTNEVAKLKKYLKISWFVEFVWVKSTCIYTVKQKKHIKVEVIELSDSSDAVSIEKGIEGSSKPSIPPFGSAKRPRTVPKNLIDWYGYVGTWLPEEGGVDEFPAETDKEDEDCQKIVKSPTPIFNAVLGLPSKTTWATMVKKMGIRGAGNTGKGKEKYALSSSSVSAGYIIEFMLEDLEAVPADYVPAGHVLISADRYRIC